MSLPYAKVIVNPAAGGYSVDRIWPRIESRLRDIGLSFDHEHTEGKGHAIELARKAVDDGYGYLIAVGGDGTVNEVANGILSSTAAGNTILGVVSGGTACSLARSLALPRECAAACSLLMGQGRLTIDVGVVEYQSGGQSRRRFFINEASTGFGATIMETSRHSSKHIGSAINYVFHVVRGLRSLFRYRNKQITLRLGGKTETVCNCAVVVANGGYAAGGMYLAPQAKLDDGLLDVVIAGDMGSIELLRLWPALYRGSHTTHAKIRAEKVTSISVQSAERVLVEADGEPLGECPASFWVMPAALTVVV